MPNYQLGKIYQIVNDVNDYIYVGSTAQKLLSVRFGNHKAMSLDIKKTSPLYEAIRAIGVEHFRIILIHNFPCNSKQELEAEEYRTMKEIKQRGSLLYNVSLDGKHSDETKQKIGDKHKGKTHTDATKQKLRDLNTGEKHPQFNHGTIYFNKSTQAWKFQWCKNNKQHNKSYSIKKYGFFEALFKSQEERKKMYPTWLTPEEETIQEFLNIEI